MKLYVVLSDSSTTPFGIYDTFENASKYVYAHPTQHLCIFEYELNSTEQGKNIFDNYFTKI